MAVTFQELRQDGTMRIQSGGPVSATRVFLVPGASESVARANPDLLTNAAVGMQHPSEPLLKVAAHSILEKVGADEGYKVEAYYNLTGTTVFDFPPPDRQSLGFTSAGFTQHVLEIDVPLILRRDVLAPTSAGPIIYDDWVKSPKDIKFQVRGLRFHAEFNTDVFGQPQLQAIVTETNKIHRFWGADWLFRAGRQDKIFRDGVWNVVFQWEAEPGHSLAQIDAMGYGQSNLDIAPLTIRPPHGVWDVTVELRPPFLEARPFVNTRVPHVVNPNGYQTLPGYGSKWSL